uniref:Uncharacterized protein n=1 Tax=Timema tahoe TaxID=61484 RepID=A0A7R9NW57_9NEOP|nr:unnamed protein product [Timema tahoe]
MSSINNNCGRTRALAASFSGDTPNSSHIPRPRATPASSMADREQVNNRWKTCFEDAEKKRKLLLIQNQKSDRDQNDLQRRYQLLHNEYNTVLKQLNDKQNKLDQLRKVSEAMYKEYDLLKNKYDVDQIVMQGAMDSASQNLYEVLALPKEAQCVDVSGVMERRDIQA